MVSAHQRRCAPDLRIKALIHIMCLQCLCYNVQDTSSRTTTHALQRREKPRLSGSTSRYSLVLWDVMAGVVYHMH